MGLCSSEAGCSTLDLCRGFNFLLCVRLPLCRLSGCRLRPPLPCAGLTGSLGASAGVGFAVSHELTHGRTRSDKFMAGLLLCLTYYMHWDNSHQAHHVKVRAAH